MRVERWMLVALVWVVALVGNGCAQRPTVLHPDFGAAYTLATEGQTLAPQAGQNLQPVVGLDGYAAAAIVYTYRKQFEERQAVQQGSVVAQGIQTR